MYQEDFEDGVANDFRLIGGLWTVIQHDNNWVLQGEFPVNGRQTEFIMPVDSWENYVITGRFLWVKHIIDGRGRVTIGVRTQENVRSYKVFIDYPSYAGSYRENLTGITDIVTADFIPFWYDDFRTSPREWNTFRIEVLNSDGTVIIRTWINGFRLGDTLDYAMLYPTGGISLGMWEGTTVYFDDILIYEIPDSELP